MSVFEDMVLIEVREQDSYGRTQTRITVQLLSCGVKLCTHTALLDNILRPQTISFSHVLGCGEPHAVQFHRVHVRNSLEWAWKEVVQELPAWNLQGHA
eukprot:6138520-Amphidinium_carterae.1